MNLLLQGGNAFFFSTKALRLSITKDILQAITFPPSVNINKLNLYTTFKVAWAGFMQLRKITYTNTKKHYLLFKDLHLIYSNITFFENDQYITLYLKQSKIDTNYARIFIMLAATTLFFLPSISTLHIFYLRPSAGLFSTFFIQ